MHSRTMMTLTTATTVFLLAVLLAMDRCNERETAAKAACVTEGNNPIECREMLRTPVH